MLINRIILSDILSGKNVWKKYKEYDKTQWYSQEQMQLYQVEKIKKLLNHCNENIPYYQSIIKERKIDIENFTGLDVLQEFPILTKEIIQANYEDFIPKNNSRIKGAKTKQTGGTTGNMLFKRNDASTRSSIWATYERYKGWMGIAESDSVLVLMGGHVKKNNLKDKVISGIKNTIDTSVRVDIYNTSEKTIDTVINYLQSGSFTHIRSYPQFLFSVAKKLQQKGITFNIKSISTTAEPIMEEHRKLFREVFNAEVFDQYGCGEIGGVAYECDAHQGLHIADERVVLELNELNELIITDLDNYTMPFIRYWNADQAIISKQKCSCGRQSRLIKQILGRTCDYVTGDNNQFLHWAYFWHLIFDSEIAKNRNLKKFQIVQQDTNLLVIRLVADHLSNQEELFFVNDIRSRLGDVNVEFSYETDIENTKTGKYRPVINKLIS